ncbi:PorT family protein [Emticicia sp. 21SJ11W-3]|uniref:PorT family protein n=1 Tax=Emticicia sp. 21SJ11W-3 TaxID=2916755 RepID=UPI00209ED7DA|nr:PorT family protein [Emticicia sp. 21SJ11W-3]UTA66825.1 PorT family protein [Emticicia sp. 21SJ11W-3]
MANELFDKKIREKLESVRRPVSEGVWQNIRGRMLVPWYLDFWRRFGWPLYGSLATVLLIWNFIDKYDYEKQFRILNDKISTIEQIKTNTQVQEIVHRDTVYINKTIYVVQKAPVTSTGNANSPRPVVYEAPVQVTITDKSVADAGTTSVTEAQEPKPEGATTIEKADEPSVIKKSADSVYKRPVITPAEQRRSFRWPRIDTRLGLNTGLGFNHTLDLGPVFEVFFGKSLSFTTGLTFLTNPEAEYYNPKEFNLDTRQNFTDMYKHYLPERYERIEDIHIRASMLSIPLNLNYYLPLNRRWDMKFMAGTNLDLRLYQNVRFEAHVDGDELYSSFNTEQKKGLIHNLSLGTGLQYRHKRYVFQLTPVYIYHYRDTDFLSPRYNFRVNGSVLINLKREK